MLRPESADMRRKTPPARLARQAGREAACDYFFRC
jgi:hypothetical protein